MMQTNQQSVYYDEDKFQSHSPQCLKVPLLFAQLCVVLLLLSPVQKCKNKLH